VDEDWWVAVAVEDVTWCGEIGVVVEEALDAVGLVEKGGGGSVIFDDIVEIVGDVCLAEMRGAGCAL
jgi:hypothetical protein